MTTNDTAQTAKEEVGAVAGTVKDETKQFAQQATEQARGLVDELHGDVRQRAEQQATKVAQTLHTTSRQLSSMANSSDQNQGVVPALLREGANTVDRIAGRLDAGGLDAVFSDVRSWARRNPGTFVLGALAAGFVGGRFVRNLSRDQFSSNGSSPGYMSQGDGFNQYADLIAEQDEIDMRSSGLAS